jgi:hypothetical protein
MAIFFNILKILLSVLMIVFGIRIFVFAAKAKQFKREHLGRKKRVEDAEKLAERGMVEILNEETKKFQQVEKNLRWADTNHKFYNDLLAGCAIILAALEILLTVSSFVKR